MGTISLRMPNNDDLNVLSMWENDISNSEYTDFPSFYTREQLVQFLDSKQDILMNNQIRYMICVDNNPIGCIDLFDYDLVNSRAGVGIFIDPELQSKGWGFLALQELKELSLKNHLLNQLYATVYSSNEKSLKLFIKAGFVQTGTRKKWVRKEDGYEDVHFFQCFL